MCKERKVDMTFFDRLSQIMKENPDLVFSNDGYENLSRDVVAANADAIREIEMILKQCIKGFVSFQNFKPYKDGSIAVRYQVHYNDQGSFTGVAYTSLEEFKV